LFFVFSFFTPFVLQSRYQWFRETFLNLCISLKSRFVMLVVIVLDGFMELAFAPQENPYRCFPRKVAVLPYFCFLQSFNI